MLVIETKKCTRDVFAVKREGCWCFLFLLYLFAEVHRKAKSRLTWKEIGLKCSDKFFYFLLANVGRRVVGGFKAPGCTVFQPTNAWLLLSTEVSWHVAMGTSFQSNILRVLNFMAQASWHIGSRQSLRTRTVPPPSFPLWFNSESIQNWIQRCKNIWKEDRHQTSQMLCFSLSQKRFKLPDSIHNLVTTCPLTQLTLICLFVQKRQSPFTNRPFLNF